MTDPDRSPVDRLTAGANALSRRLVEAVPDSAKRRLAGPYNRVKEFEADRSFGGRSRPSVTPAEDAPDHVVCVVVDAMRDDALAPDHAPFLTDRHRRTLWTPAPWTFPAVTSLLTGRYPNEHGAMRGGDEADTGASDLTVPPKLSAEATTLADALAGAGYDTYGAFAFHMPFFALSGRFERHALYDDAPADELVSDYLEWRVDAGDRTFAYLHLGDLHEPVDPPQAYWKRHDVDASIPNVRRWEYETVADVDEAGERYRDHRRRLYDAAVDYVDDRLSALAADLRDGPGKTCLVVTADHGEAFWEHTAFDADTFVDSRPAYCVDHGGTPYECLTQVPLVTEGTGLGALPGIEAADRTRRGSLVDIAPTLAAVCGVEAALPATGRDLRRAVPTDRIPVVEAARYGHEKKAAYLDDWKVVVSKGDDAIVGFSLPEEEPTTLPEGVRARLLERLPPFPDGSTADVRVSGLARDRLDDLGYV